MRHLEKCSECGYQEALNWRPSYMNINRDVIRAFEAPELAKKLTPGVSVTLGDWTYKLSKTREWIERMLSSVYEAEGWRRRYKGGVKGNPRQKLANKQNRNIGHRSKQGKLLK